MDIPNVNALSPEAHAVQALFYIQGKDKFKVPFRLLPAQRFFDQHESNRMIIAKARQKGFSSFILAKFGIRCLGEHGTRAVVMSHETDATQRLLDRLNYYLKHMNGPPPQFGRHSRNEMYFDKMDSAMYIGTAGKRAFGRGDTITNLHCSEYAWWENAEQHHTGAFQAVPGSGQIILESTGNGRANDFYFTWKNADNMNFTRLFYPWFADMEYELETDKKYIPDIPGLNSYLRELQDKHKLSDRKMAWYELKLKELREDLRKMNQEYPSEPEDCFQATGGTLFNNVEIKKHPFWIQDKKLGYFCYFLKNHPDEKLHYVVGADPSGGTGNDDAAINIFCCETGEQVLELFNNNIQPIRFADIICQLGKEYNEAFVVCEANNHGVAVTEYLKIHYPKNKLYKRRLATRSRPAEYGWLNSQQTKHALVAMMQEDLSSIILYGASTGSELQSFSETETGRFEGESDNLVIATGLAMLGLKRFESLRGVHLLKFEELEKPKPNYMSFTLDEALDNIHKKHTVRDYRTYH